MNKRKLTLLLEGCLLLSSMYPLTFASAQSSEAKPAFINQPLSIEVGAARGGNLSDLNVSTTVLTREQVLALPETSTDQILNTIPGINISTAEGAMNPTGEGANLQMRGMGTATNIMTLVMVDGVPVNDSYFKTVNWSAIPKENIERIEVIRGGGATSVWGNMAMAGVINIVTRTPESGKSTVQVGYGSFNTTTASASTAFDMSESVKVSAFANTSYSDGYNPNQPNSTMKANPYMQSETGSRSDNGQISAYISPSASSKYVVSLLASHSEQSNQNYENQSDNWNTYRLSVNGSTKFTDIERMDLAAWVDTGGMGLQNTSGSTSNSNAVKMIDTINSGSAGGSAIFNTAWSEVKDIQAGVDVKQLSANNNSYLPGIVNSGVTSATTLTSSGTQWFQGLFAKGTYRPTDVPVDVTLGLRQDFWQTVNGTTSTTGSLANQNYTHFDPSLSAKYYATDALDFRGSVYQNFAAPGMNQMYRTFVSGGGTQAFWLANPNLQPETNFGQEIGFDFKQANYKFGGTIFNNTVNNYIDYIRCSSSNSCIAQGTLPSSITATNFNQYQNVGNANFKGFELLGNWDVTSSIGLNAGATRTLATLTSATGAAANQSTNPQVLDRQLGGVPSWVFTAGIKWQATSDLQFNAKMRAIPGYYDSLTATSTSPRDGGMAIFDLGANYRLNPSSTIYASIQNIGNRQYIDNQNSGYTNLGMPLNATVGIRYTF